MLAPGTAPTKTAVANTSTTHQQQPPKPGPFPELLFSGSVGENGEPVDWSFDGEDEDTLPPPPSQPSPSPDVVPMTPQSTEGTAGPSGHQAPDLDSHFGRSATRAPDPALKKLQSEIHIPHPTQEIPPAAQRPLSHQILHRCGINRASSVGAPLDTGTRVRPRHGEDDSTRQHGGTTVKEARTGMTAGTTATEAVWRFSTIAGTRVTDSAAQSRVSRRAAFLAWMRGRCFNCLASDHRVTTCHDPAKCWSCRRSGHICHHCP